MRRLAFRVLKWTGIGLGGVVGVIILAVVVVYFLVGSRLNKIYDVQAANIDIPIDPPSEARGWPLFIIGLACQECHEAGLKGDVMSDDLVFGRIVAPNLTSGKGGIGTTYTDADWVLAIRHGVGPDGKPLFLMPSHEFNKFGDADLGLIIAYLKSLPSEDNELSSTRVGPLGRILTLLESEFIPARVIDPDAPSPSVPERGVTLEYGAYMAFVCAVCHGDSLSGGSVPFDEPDSPPPPNLTPAGELQAWSEADFINTMRTGVTPFGRPLDVEFMPWDDIGLLTDDELKAIWMYLQSLPAKGFKEK